MNEMQFERRGPVAVLTFNRPSHHNAMTWEMYLRLVELCDEVDRDDAIRVWVMRGAGGKAFISGTDIGQFTDFKGKPGAGLEYEAKLDRVIGRLARVEKPTIAMIEGYAVGGGLLLAINCDLRLATPDSKFCVPCINLGNCLSMANYAKILELVGPARTLEMVYTGRLVEAEEAYQAGLLNKVVARDEIETQVMELATTIARAAPLTVKVTKEAVRRLSHGTIPNAADLTNACYDSDDFQEGVAAFLEKRKPVWQGK